VILIFGQMSDPHVVAVCRSLEQTGSQYCVVDAFDKRSSGITYRVAERVNLELRGNKHEVEECSAIWWRVKPRFVVPTASVTDLYDYNFVHREWLQIVEFIGGETRRTFSINNRQNADRANNKMLQLQEAVAVGFEIPRTLISNDPDAVIAFVESHKDGRVVYKPFTPYMPPTGLITFTTAIDSSIVHANRDGVAAAPGIYQELVKKAYELRITVVGNDLFPAKINSNHSEMTQVDWRRELYGDIYTAFQIADEIKEKITRLHRKLGLFFAAYDFIVNDEGRMIFLEVNPTGQWLWLEEKLGFPISQRIANALAIPEKHGGTADNCIG
jgi:hypothetical protein